MPFPLSVAPWLLVFCLSACATNEPDGRDPLDAGEWRTTKSRMYQDLALQCLQAEDHDRARRLLQQAVQFDPRDGKSLELLARLAFAHGDLATAKGAAQLLLKLDAESIAALCTLGAVHEARSQLVEAEALYRQALAFAQTDPRPFIDLHRLLLLAGRETEATELRRAGADRFPRAIETELDHGAHLAATSQWGAATTAFDRALAIQPNDASAVTGFALSAVMSQQPAAALDLGNRLPPHARADNPSLLLTLAIAHLQAGDYEAALRELDLGGRETKNRTAMRVLRGEILFRMQHIEAAQAEFEAAIALDPDAARAHASLGRIHLMQRNYHAATRSLQRAVAIQSGNGSSHALLAASLAATGDLAAATRHLVIAGRLPNTAPLLAELARLHPALTAAEASR